MTTIRTLLRSAFLLLVASSCSPAAQPQQEVQPADAVPVLAPRTVAVELFTSQGCSSCPPADAVLERVAREPHVVVMSRPVTYWDRLGWPDTFGRPENDALQRGYVTRLGAQSNYTPQAVVQGRSELVGSNEPALRSHIARAAEQQGVELTLRGGAVSVRGPEGPPAEVRLVALRSSADVEIRRGENRNRTVRYTNVVIEDEVIGHWRGGTAVISLPTGSMRVANADRYALLVQQAGAGPILAAAYVEPPGR